MSDSSKIQKFKEEFRIVVEREISSYFDIYSKSTNDNIMITHQLISKYVDDVYSKMFAYGVSQDQLNDKSPLSWEKSLVKEYIYNLSDLTQDYNWWMPKVGC